MQTISNILKDRKYPKSPVKRHFKAKCPPERFKDLFLNFAKEEIHRSGDSFDIDIGNQEVINQLYYYLIGSPSFNGALQKGILLIGAIGSGKTVLMNAFVKVFNEVAAPKKITVRNSKEIIDIVLAKYENGFKSIPLFVDDIGKEEIKATIFGTDYSPMIDLIDFRYDKDGLTFATSNLTLEDMKYPLHTTDRMKQMFNIIVLPSSSRRK